MTPSFVAVLPALDAELAGACLASMCPELRDNLLLIDNSGTGKIAREWAGDVAFAVAQASNAGVPKSWNQGIHLARAQNAEYLIILSQSITFGAPEGKDFLSELELRDPPVLMHSQHGWKTLALHRDVWNLVGLFDEVFSPGYREDRDYLWRMHLAGLPNPLTNDGRFDQINIDAESAGDAQAILRGMVRVDMVANMRAYVAKWGSETGDEQWTTPYNDETLDFSFVGEYGGVKA